MDAPSIVEAPIEYDLPFFGVVRPLPARIVWNGQERDIMVHVPTDGEELDLIAWVHAFPEEQRLLAEAVGRVAIGLLQVDGRAVRAEYPTFEDRVRWVQDFPGTLLDAVLAGMTLTRDRPRIELAAALEAMGEVAQDTEARAALERAREREQQRRSVEGASAPPDREGAALSRDALHPKDRHPPPRG